MARFVHQMASHPIECLQRVTPRPRIAQHQIFGNQRVERVPLRGVLPALAQQAIQRAMERFGAQLLAHRRG